MKTRKIFYGILALLLILSVSGCGTVPKKFKEEVSGIKSKVDTLESRVESMESKQVEVERAASEQAQTLDELKRIRERAVSTNVSVKPKTSVKMKEGIKDIQTCLKNAGFYSGKIDGVKGRGTKKAIKEFQRANGLRPDGRVGPKTWELLNKYASGPDAKGQAAIEEGAK